MLSEKCFVVFYVFSFPPGVYVATLNLIASIPDPSILTSLRHLACITITTRFSCVGIFITLNHIFVYFSQNIKNYIMLQPQLTIKKTAPSNVALTFTSKSMGNEIPKLSASVKASLARPVHCLVTRPT